MAIKLAPLVVPLRRRRQTLAVSIFLVFIPAITIFLTLWMLITPWTWAFYVPYLIWVLFFDAVPEDGGRKLELCRRFFLWRHFRGYFPAELRLQNPSSGATKFDPKQKYLFAIHPHGIIGVSVWANFFNDVSGASKLINNIDYRVATISANFRLPFWRDFLLGCGLISASRKSLSNTLRRGISTMVVVGGAEEALDARPGTIDLTLAKRKGFVRIAIEEGAALVPIFSFGENEVYDQVLANPPGSRVRDLQDFFKRVVGYSTPIVKGRGFFNYSFGLLPHRCHLVTVIGDPLPLEKKDNPTQEDVDRVHALYVSKLEALYKEFEAELQGDETIWRTKRKDRLKIVK